MDPWITATGGVSPALAGRTPHPGHAVSHRGTGSSADKGRRATSSIRRRSGTSASRRGCHVHDRAGTTRTRGPRTSSGTTRRRDRTNHRGTTNNRGATNRRYRHRHRHEAGSGRRPGRHPTIRRRCGRRSQAGNGIWPGCTNRATPRPGRKSHAAGTFRRTTTSGRSRAGTRARWPPRPVGSPYRWFCICSGR